VSRRDRDSTSADGGVQVRKLLQEMRLEKLPLVDKEWNILGLITARDFYHALNNPHTTHDRQRRLIVGAAIGVKVKRERERERERGR
jgi:CBS-domain-containing membrane protein